MSELELGVVARMYNATIRTRRRQLGLTQRQVAEKAGVSVTTVGGMETLRKVRQTPGALAVLRVLGLSNEAQPPWLEALELHGERRQERRVTPELMAGLEPQRLLPQGESDRGRGTETMMEAMAQEEVQEVLRAGLAELAERDRRVLELRYGIHGKYPLTLDEVGRMFNISRERVKQVENQALKRLQSLADMQRARQEGEPRAIDLARRREAAERRREAKLLQAIQLRREQHAAS